MVPRHSIRSALFCCATLVATCSRVGAMDAEQVFDKAAPSVVTVESQDANGVLLSFGSGVVVAPGEIITNCHVLRDGVLLHVKKEGHSASAYLHFSDKARDLCQLQANQATAFTRPVRAIIAMSDLRVGQHVYAIGAPRGLELTLSDGLISGLRHSAGGSVQLIQTTAPVSPGSSGGGLFDQDGRLVGITTFVLKESQNLNFAVPAMWVQELQSKQPDLLEQRKRQGEAKAGTKGKDTEIEPRTSDTGDYAHKVQDKIQRLITYPAARAGQLRAEFAISVMTSGWPVRVDLMQSSGDADFDTKARGAILAASPLHDAQEVHFDGLRNFRVTLRAISTEPEQSKGDDYPVLKRFQQDILARIGNVVSEQDYPRDARDRGWQGLTIVRVTIGRDARLKDVTVIRSSRFALLDEHAVSKIREMQLPSVPEELSGREFSVDVPLRFTLGPRELQ